MTESERFNNLCKGPEYRKNHRRYRRLRRAYVRAMKHVLSGSALYDYNYFLSMIGINIRFLYRYFSSDLTYGGLSKESMDALKRCDEILKKYNYNISDNSDIGSLPKLSRNQLTEFLVRHHFDYDHRRHMWVYVGPLIDGNPLSAANDIPVTPISDEEHQKDIAELFRLIGEQCTNWWD